MHPAPVADLPRLRKMQDRPHRLLLVCSGNICRTPMAVALARLHADRLGLRLEVDSAGTLGIVDAPADPKAVDVCRELGLDLSAHRSKALTPELVAWADDIVVMELAHATFVRQLALDVPEGRVILLGSHGGLSDIADPIGSWFKGPFRTARDEIDRCLQAYLARLSP